MSSQQDEPMNEQSNWMAALSLIVIVGAVFLVGFFAGEEGIKQVLNVVSIIAIVLVCLGLGGFGLAGLWYFIVGIRDAVRDEDKPKDP